MNWTWLKIIQDLYCWSPSIRIEALWADCNCWKFNFVNGLCQSFHNRNCWCCFPICNTSRMHNEWKQDFLLETLKSTFLNEIHFVLAKLRNVLINDHHVIVRPENWFTFWGHGSNCEMLKQHFAYIFWFWTGHKCKQLLFLLHSLISLSRLSNYLAWICKYLAFLLTEK